MVCRLWYADKLVLGQKELWYIVFVDFCGLNCLTLISSCQWIKNGACKTPEYLTINFGLPVRAKSSTPLCVYYILKSTVLEDIYTKFKSILFISAFDMVHDPMAALETLLTLGFERVLTSGCDSSALEGLPLIKRLIEQVSHNFFPFFLTLLWLRLIFCCLARLGN